MSNQLTRDCSPEFQIVPLKLLQPSVNFTNQRGEPIISITLPEGAAWSDFDKVLAGETKWVFHINGRTYSLTGEQLADVVKAAKL